MPNSLIDMAYAPGMGAGEYPPDLKHYRNALDPASGWDYGNVLPMAWNKKGDVRLALPNAVRSALQGYIDMLASPHTGGLTPEAVQTMAGGTGGTAAMMRPQAGVIAEGIARSMPRPKDPWVAPQIEPKGIVAYHGSPAEFNRFSDEFIGTGEGAQAYGMGHYTAGNEQVAQDYRKKLSGNSKVSLGGVDYLTHNTHDYYGKPYPEGQSPPGREALMGRLVTEYGVDPHSAQIITNELQDKSGNVGRANQYLKRVFPVESPIRKVLDAMEEKKSGHTYEVAIHADPEQMLNWDAPVHQQPKAVQDLAEQWAKEPSPYEGQYWPGSGAELYRQLGRGGTKEAAAVKLKEAGVPGIKYLDRGSRGAGEGSHNYVVFDPKMMSILRKYGLGGFGPGNALPGMVHGQPQQQPTSIIPNALLPMLMGNQS